MYKNFTLTESERESILNQHKEHGYKQPINEQVKQPTGDFTTIGRFGSFDAGRLKERGFIVKGGVATLNHPHPKLVVTVKPSKKGWAAYQGGVLKFDLPHDDCDVELDKLIGYNSLQGGYKKPMNEQISKFSNPDDFGVKGMVKQVNQNIQGQKSLVIKGGPDFYLKNNSPQENTALGILPESLGYPFKFSVERKQPSSFGVSSNEMDAYIDYLGVYGKIPGTGIPIPYQGNDLNEMIQILQGGSHYNNSMGIYGSIEERTSEQNGKIYPAVEVIRSSYKSRTGKSIWDSLQKKMTDSDEDMERKEHIQMLLMNAYKVWIDCANGLREDINEQQEGGSREYDHWQDVRIQLIDSGFKNDTNKNLEQYGTSHSLSYGGHNDGVNVLWNKPNNAPWSYIVWVGDNKHKKTFPLGGTNNSSKSAASQVIKYALSLMSLVSKKPMNEGLGLVTGQECYRFGEVYVCVGDKSEYVMNLQKQLNQSNCQKGLPPISLDGVFGPETKERIMINQKSNCKVPGFNTQQYKRIKTPTGEKYVPVQVSGTNLA